MACGSCVGSKPQSSSSAVIKVCTQPPISERGMGSEFPGNSPGSGGGTRPDSALLLPPRAPPPLPPLCRRLPNLCWRRSHFPQGGQPRLQRSQFLFDRHCKTALGWLRHHLLQSLDPRHSLLKVCWHFSASSSWSRCSSSRFASTRFSAPSR